MSFESKLSIKLFRLTWSCFEVVQFSLKKVLYPMRFTNWIEGLDSNHLIENQNPIIEFLWLEDSFLDSPKQMVISNW